MGEEMGDILKLCHWPRAPPININPGNTPTYQQDLPGWDLLPSTHKDIIEQKHVTQLPSVSNLLHYQPLLRQVALAFRLQINKCIIS